MKKINFIKLIIIVIIFYPGIVNASCGEILDANTCKNTSGCYWGYNGASEMHCYSDASSIKNAIENSSKTKSPIQFCAKTATIWQIVGYVFLIVKIVIPLLLIILGVVDLSKAVIGGKDDELKKSMKSMMWRAISAVIIFFVPTIVNIVMNLISNFSESGAKADYKVCQACILSPNSKKCDTSKDAGKR